MGTDSHTTMVNGLGVLGWGVGGIEAEAAMLGQPVSMLIPQVVGFRLEGELPEGATATDLVLTVTEMLREHGVVGKFVEFFGPGLANLPLADRATIGNMSPEYGATCAIFPVDAETLRYLEFTGRPAEQIELVEAYAQGAGPVPRRGLRGRHVLRHAGARPVDGRALLAGPKRPQDRMALVERRHATSSSELARRRDGDHGGDGLAESFPASDPPADGGPTRTTASPRTSTASAAVEDGRKRRRRVTLDGDGVRAGARRRGHRRHHQLHQHLEPVGHARRRPAGQERRRARA